MGIGITRRPPASLPVRMWVDLAPSAREPFNGHGYAYANAEGSDVASAPSYEYVRARQMRVIYSVPGL